MIAVTMPPTPPYLKPLSAAGYTMASSPFQSFSCTISNTAHMTTVSPPALEKHTSTYLAQRGNLREETSREVSAIDRVHESQLAQDFRLLSPAKMKGGGCQ